MGRSHYFFAAGGTGGHIYPAIAVAEQIRKADADAQITFLGSERAIDSRILAGTEFEFVPLPVKSFSLRPGKFAVFCMTLIKSCKIARQRIAPYADRSVVIGTGGFASAPAVFAANKLNVPVVMLNVDSVPGRANRLLARFAKEIFVQFADTAEYFAAKKAKVSVTGCPLRAGFAGCSKSRFPEETGLDESKKTLIVTGASSGAMNINNALCRISGELGRFADSWQIVHLTGVNDFERVRESYAAAKIGHKVFDYYDDMAGLLAGADLIVGRAGAVSVAEYAAAGVAAICMPYPYHRDRHQYLNAAKLVEAGGAVIVDDLPADNEQTSGNLLRELTALMADDQRRTEMGRCARGMAKLDAAEKITQAIMGFMQNPRVIA
ncbi:MAG: UDP-N-acetylglucosamine--N-acetylmuramyl-(pentapeptide) pyrophosphoryl-undecaprenol N-acetylglucosamine transferase [Planctomycetota bacterium]|jgi:UDP-N-acetylglucosamine--N-acetylmuramyl-(pentapeptide) pyrophosphoryl-undecaprenol N-acetylglucosamine transferase